MAQSRGIFYFYILIGSPDYISTLKKNIKSVLSFFKIRSNITYINETDDKSKKEEGET